MRVWLFSVALWYTKQNNIQYNRVIFTHTQNQEPPETLIETRKSGKVVAALPNREKTTTTQDWMTFTGLLMYENECDKQSTDTDVVVWLSMAPLKPRLSNCVVSMQGLGWKFDFRVPIVTKEFTRIISLLYKIIILTLLLLLLFNYYMSLTVNNYINRPIQSKVMFFSPVTSV